MTDQIKKEIAELLECGHICFVHSKTGEFEYHPDELHDDFDKEPWQDVIDKIEENWDDYFKIEKMDSSESFKLMDDFVNTLKSLEIKDDLHDALSRPKPFRNFKDIIDQSKYRQNWFDFKSEKYIDSVNRQIEMNKPAPNSK